MSIFHALLYNMSERADIKVNNIEQYIIMFRLPVKTYIINPANIDNNIM